MNELTSHIREMLHACGADLVGFADIADVEQTDYPKAIAVGIKLPVSVVRDIENGPTAAYHEAYHDTNHRLDELVTFAESYLYGQGYGAYALSRKNAPISSDNRVPIPHKTIAYRAGLGWIGKNNLIITPEFGGAVRISSVLTDAPLDTCRSPIPARCGSCKICTQACPAGAIIGNAWHVGMDRDDMFRMRDCEAMANRLSFENFGVPDAGICGICFARCPYTRQYTKQIIK